jgi:hypothetical protein
VHQMHRGFPASSESSPSLEQMEFRKNFLSKWNIVGLLFGRLLARIAKCFLYGSPREVKFHIAALAALSALATLAALALALCPYPRCPCPCHPCCPCYCRWSLMASIAVIVDGSSDGIELMAPMAASSTVAAVDGGSDNGIFTTPSHDNNHLLN